jgi:hypothetical protein
MSQDPKSIAAAYFETSRLSCHSVTFQVPRLPTPSIICPCNRIRARWMIERWGDRGRERERCSVNLY